MTRHRFEACIDKVFALRFRERSARGTADFPSALRQRCLTPSSSVPRCRFQPAADRGRVRHHGALARRIGPVSDDALAYSLERRCPNPCSRSRCWKCSPPETRPVFYAPTGPEGSWWQRSMALKSAVRLPAVARPVATGAIRRRVNGELKTDIQYYHRIVVVVLVSTSFPIPLGVRFQKNGEAEVSCALALLQDLVGQLGRRFLDVLVGDALYLQAPFVQASGTSRSGLGLHLEREPARVIARGGALYPGILPPVFRQEPGREIQYWHLPEVDWPVADRLVRVVKTVRTEQQRRVTLREKTLLEPKARRR